MMRFHKGALFLRYALSHVNTILQSFFSSLVHCLQQLIVTDKLKATFS